MFDKAKETVDYVKDGIHKKSVERVYNKKKKILEQQKQAAEQNEFNRKELEKEYSRLESLEDKKLMIELIFAVRGFYQDFQELKAEQFELSNSIEKLESEISGIRSELYSKREENN